MHIWKEFMNGKRLEEKKVSKELAYQPSIFKELKFSYFVFKIPIFIFYAQGFDKF